MTITPGPDERDYAINARIKAMRMTRAEMTQMLAFLSGYSPSGTEYALNMIVDDRARDRAAKHARRQAADGASTEQKVSPRMTTINELAHRFGMQPYEVQASADVHHIGQSDELNAEQEEFIVDVLTNTGPDGVYRDPDAR